MLDLPGLLTISDENFDLGTHGVSDLAPSELTWVGWKGRKLGREGGVSDAVPITISILKSFLQLKPGVSQNEEREELP